MERILVMGTSSPSCCTPPRPWPARWLRGRTARPRARPGWRWCRAGGGCGWPARGSAAELRGGGDAGRGGLAEPAGWLLPALDVAEDVLLGDAAGGAGAGDLVQVDVVVAGDLADERRGARRLACGGGGAGLRRAAAAGAAAAAARLRGGGLPACGGRASADDGDDGVDADGGAFLDLDLGERAGDGRGDLGVDLVGGDLEDGLVALRRCRRHS